MAGSGLGVGGANRNQAEVSPYRCGNELRKCLAATVEGLRQRKKESGPALGEAGRI